AGRGARMPSAGDDVAELLDGPVELGRPDDERRRDADRLTVGVFDEHAPREEPFGHLAARADGRVDVDAGPQPRDAHGRDTVTDELPQPLLQVLAEGDRAGLELARREHL